MALDIPKPDLRRPKGKSLLAPARGKARDRSDACHLRDYAPGDDYRQIDWTWCARRDEILTKVRPPYAQESLFLLLDCSRSMGMGSPVKIELGRRIAAILGADALRHEQTVCAAAFGSRLESLFPLRWGLTGVARLMQFLAAIDPQGDDTDLAAAADGLARTTPRRGPAVLVSDLLDRRGVQAGIDRLLQHGFEPMVVQPIVKADADAPCLGEVELLDIETSQPRKAIITELAATEFRRRVEAFYLSVREHCLKRRVICLQPPHDAHAEEVVAQLASAAANRRPRRGSGVSP